MLPLTEHYMDQCVTLVAKVRDEAVMNAFIETNDKNLELEFMLLKYQALCITLDKIHKSLIEIQGLAKDEKSHYLIINITPNEDEIEAQAD
jgi:hypothetical protein